LKTKLCVLTLVALGSLFLGQAVLAEDPAKNQVGRAPQADSLTVVADLATVADLEREGSRIRVAFVLNDQEEPAVAYSISSGQYLVVYQSSANSGNILGRYVDAYTGDHLGSNVFVISSTTAAERSPDVVYDPDTERFLVVWEEQRCLGIPQKCYWVIKGRMLHGIFQGEGASNLAGDAFTVSSEHSTLVAGYDHRDPAVAYNAAGEYYVVVFLRGQESTGDYHGVRGQMLQSSATQPTVEFGLEGFVIQSYSTYTASTPDVAWAPGSDGFLTTWATTRADGTRYVAIAYVWDQPVPGSQVIRTWQVAPLDWGEYPLTHDCLAPAVAYDPVYDAYLVVFEHWVGGDAFANYTIYGTWLTPINHSEGVSIGSAFPIETEVSETSDTHHQPDVVFSDHAGKMHVTYRTVDYIINEDFLHTVYARSVYRRTVGDRLDVSNTVFPERDVENPAIASAGNGRSLIVWSEEFGQGDKDIYGQRIRPV